MKKARLLGALAALLVFPTMASAAGDVLTVANMVSYTDNAGATHQGLPGTGTIVRGIEFNDYNIEYTTGTGSTTKTTYNVSSGTSYIQVCMNYTATIRPKNSSYIAGVSFKMLPISGKYPQGGELEFYDGSGNPISGKYETSEDGSVYTWTADNTGGYSAICVKVLSTASANMRTSEYVVYPASATATYADLFDLTLKENAEIFAGDAEPQGDTLGNIGFEFDGKPELNTDCKDLMTLRHNGTVVYSWATDGKDLFIDTDNYGVYVEGVNAEDVVNPGEYVLTVPRGFFKVGDVYANGLTATYTAKANTKEIAVLTAEDVDGVPALKVSNNAGYENPVLTDAFKVIAAGGTYTAEDAVVVGNDVFVKLVKGNAIEEGRSYNVDLDAGSIAWLDGDYYLYNQGFSFYPIVIVPQTETPDPEDPEDPETPSDAVKLIVKDATSVSYTSGGNVLNTTLQGKTQYNLVGLTIGDYTFDVATAYTGNSQGYKPQAYYYASQAGTDKEFALALIATQKQSVTVNAPAGTYMNALTVKLEPTTTSTYEFPAEAGYAMLDKNGQEVKGEFKFNEDRSEFTWTATNPAGYPALRLSVEPSTAFRAYEFDVVTAVAAPGETYADLLTPVNANGATLTAGNADPETPGSFGNLGFSYSGELEVNAACVDDVTLTFGSELIESWSVTSTDIAIDNLNGAVYFDGLDNLQVVNPGKYTLNIPRGFFKSGSTIDNGLTVNYNAAANSVGNIAVLAAEKVDGVPALKISNNAGLSGAVVTSSFYVYAAGGKYYAKDAEVVGDDVIVKLINGNTIEEGRTYNVDLSYASVAWLGENGYRYNQGFDVYPIEIVPQTETPDPEVEAVELLVNDITSYTVGNNAPQTTLGGSAAPLKNFVIGNYNFAVTSADEQATKAAQLTKVSDGEYAVTFRANNEQSITVTALDGTYLTGVKFFLAQVGEQAFPTADAYTVTDANGLDLAGEFTVEGNNVAWTGNNAAGYQAIRFVYNANVPMRTVKYAVTLPNEEGVSYADLFTFVKENDTELAAGNAYQGDANSFGNLGLAFQGKPEVNTACVEAVTLTYGKTLVKGWEATSTDITIDANNAVYFDGLTDLDVVNPGAYVLTVPRGFFKVGDDFANGGSATYKAVATVEDGIAAITEPTAATVEFNTVKIANAKGMTEPVLTDAFALTVRGKVYGKDDVKVVDNEVVCTLENPTTQAGTYYIVLADGGIAWLGDNGYVYNQAFDNYAVDILGAPTQEDNAKLLVNNISSFLYGNNDKPQTDLTNAAPLKNFVIDGFNFDVTSADEDATKAAQLTKVSDGEYAVTFRRNNEQTLTVTAPEGKYMTGLVFNLLQVGTQAYPAAEAYSFTDANGLPLAGELTLNEEGNVVTWNAKSTAGYNAIRLVFNANVPMRTYEYDVVFAAEGGNVPYADLFTLVQKDGAEMVAGNADQASPNTFGNLGIAFEGKPEVNTECVDAITLTYGKTLVKAWAVDSTDLTFDPNNAYYLDGLTDLDVVNPGAYVLNIPRGFFKVGDVFANGATATYNAKANVEEGLLAVTEPTNATVEFNTVKIANAKGMTQPVLTDAFQLIVRGKIYGKDDVQVVDNEIVCTLENPTTQGGTYYLVLAEGSIAWLGDNGYVYNAALDNYALDILGGAEEQPDVKLFVRDASSVTYMGNTKALSEVTTSQNGLTNFVIGGYDFALAAADNTATKGPQLYKGTDYDWAVTLRANNEQTLTITAPAGSYMTGVTFNLAEVGTNALPTAEAFKMTNAQGQALEGNFEVEGNVVTWTGFSDAGYDALRFVYKTNVPMRVYEFDIKRPAEGGNMSYADLFTFDIADGTEMYAGDANIQLSNTFGNLGFAFEGKPVVNENCTEKITLTYAGNIVKEWAVDSENLYFESRYQSEKVFLDGVDDADVVNPGEYVLNVPRGFFMVDGVYANGATATYKAVPYVDSSLLAAIVEPNAQTTEFSVVKIANPDITSEPVITDAFELIALGKKYTKEDAVVIDHEVVVNLVNPTSEYGTYYIDLAEGSIAWQTEYNNFVYNQNIKGWKYEFAAPAVEVEAYVEYGSNEIEVTWTNPAGTFTQGFIRYNSESVALTADQLAAEGQQTAYVTVEDGAWYNVSLVFYGENGTVESNNALVWAGDALNIHETTNLKSNEVVYDGEWVYVACAAFEEGQTYDLNVVARDANADTYTYELYLGYDLESLVSYGEFTGNINETSNTISLYVANMVNPMNEEGVVADDTTVTIPAGNIMIALKAATPTTTLTNFYIGRDATGIKGLNKADGEIEIYTLQGVRVTNPENGVYVVRQNGKTFKVMINK